MKIIHKVKQDSLYDGKKVAVIGLGIEGRDAVNYLLKQKAKVTLFDKKSENELDFSGMDKEKIDLICGDNYLEDGINGFDIIVRSPGVYPYTREIIEAQKEGAVLTSAIKIFFDECPGKIIGVTGTKGKGTTSTLIYEILKDAGCDVYLAGNIGKPYLKLLPLLNKSSYVVMEMSSFQLIDMQKSPHIAVVLNITEDHMDWHKNSDEYIDAKKNIVRHQTSGDYAVLNDGYDLPRSFYKYTKAKILYSSKYNLALPEGTKFMLRGEHNLENIGAAISVARILKIPELTITKVVENFKGLEHRLEFVAEVSGVKYYNDSFATGPQPTMAAINSFTEPETIILGGSDKGLDFGELRKLIAGKENVKNLILIGDIGEKIGGGIKNKNIINLGHVSMIQIIDTARKVAKPGEVVVLSPGAASFDMFKNYKDRGNQFKQAVLNLKD